MGPTINLDTEQSIDGGYIQNVYRFQTNQAMILKKDPSSGKKEFLCNGALIDSKRVVTVSQCLEDFQ